MDTNQNCTDYDKLLNYRNAICDLVTYDYEAQQSPLYGNSYQVINVFDDDMYSNVVCEGYAKAFQYLCDLSDFDNDVECHTVTGVTDAGAGAGEHMWNIVNIGGSDGESYLVDADLMTEVLINLIDNARKASSKGDRIILSARENVIEVQDFGRGIPKEEQEKILEPFYRIDKSRSRASGGAGLGLAITAMILKRHNCSIHMESGLGEGTRMILQFV